MRFLPALEAQLAFIDFTAANFDQDADLQKTIADNKTENKRTEDNVKEKLKENEFKLVQIVAMFVSIATFVLINVKIFDGKSGMESFAIIIGLAACFFVFNLFFHIVVVSQYEDHARVTAAMARVRRLILIPAIFAVISGLILLFQDKAFTTGQVSKLDSTIKQEAHALTFDSIQLRATDSSLARSKGQIAADSLLLRDLQEQLRALETARVRRQ